MTSKAEEIAKRVVRSWREEMSSQSLEAQLVAALREYGAEVRKRDAEKAGRADAEYQATKDAHERNVKKPFNPRAFGFNMGAIEHSRYIAASIEREELP